MEWLEGKTTTTTTSKTTKFGTPQTEFVAECSNVVTPIHCHDMRCMLQRIAQHMWFLQPCCWLACSLAVVVCPPIASHGWSGGGVFIWSSLLVCDLTNPYGYVWDHTSAAVVSGSEEGVLLKMLSSKGTLSTIWQCPDMLKIFEPMNVESQEIPAAKRPVL